MKTYHAASMHQLLSSELLQSKESISQVCDRPCPFCQREYERPIDLQQHVAGHLEFTALLSLPNLDSIDEKSEPGQINSNSANRNYAESRADDFDRMEPLVFLENDRSEDIPRMTETHKELFRRKLEVESVSFDSMNEVNVDTRQAYSSDLAGKWLSCLPIELGEEGELPSEPRSGSSSDLKFPSGLIELIRITDSLVKSCSNIDKKFETSGAHTFQDHFTELRSLPEKLKRLIEVAASLKNLSDWQESKIGVIRFRSENLTTDIDKTTIKYGTSKRESAWITGKDAQAEVNLVRFKLASISEMLSVLNASYVTPARTSCERLTFCSFPPHLKEGIAESGQDLESSGQSGMRSKVVNLITLGLSGSDSEGERPADNQMSPTSILTSSSVTEPLTFSTPQRKLSEDHWLPRVFDQSSEISSTFFKEDSDQSSACFGEPVPDAMANLDRHGYFSLGELRSPNGRFIVQIYYNPQDYSSGILCRWTWHDGWRRDCWESLATLTISRRGSFLKLTQSVEVEERPRLWACIKFPDYEGMFIRGFYPGQSLEWRFPYSDNYHPRGIQKAQEVKLKGSNNSANGRSGLVLFYCSFLALRSEGINARNTIFARHIFRDPPETVRNTISDYAIDKEQELFAG